jgi:putative ABC transport system permease protein
MVGSFFQVFGITRQALAELWGRKLRSFLTMFGIGWGVCALALITSSGEGFRQGHRKNWEQLGDRIVMVFPGRTEMQAGGRRAGKNIRLYQSDVEVIREQCSEVAAVAAETKTWGVSVESEQNAGPFLVLGVDPDYLSIRNLPAAVGRNISWGDVENRSRVCVVGHSVRNQLFEKRTDREIVGQWVRINGIRYQVVGLMSEKNQNTSYDGWDNDKVVIPSSTLRTDCPPDRGVAVEDQVQTIIYQPRSVDRWEAAQRQVRRALARIHDFDPGDEAALPMWDTIETATLFDDVLVSLRWFLGSVALITLSLGGMAVMNTMMTSVAERTAEIGLRKAVGATRLRILSEFMTEGLVLALVGGGVGMLMVAGIASVVNSFPMPDFYAGLPIDSNLVLRLALILGAVGVLSALPPAWRAANMTPVEALRYEK